MNNNLLNAFRNELRFLREVGSEFALAHPQYAAALACDDEGAADPFVERLIESVAFLTAKTACRLDAEGERLAHDILRATMPDMLYPMPPGAMVEIQPLHSLPAEADHIVPRGSALRYHSTSGEEVVFRTVSDVHLLPLRLRVLDMPDRRAISRALGTPLMASVGRSLAHCDILRVEMSTIGGQSLAASVREHLPIHCAGADAFALLTALTQKAQALVLMPCEGTGSPFRIHRFPRLLPCGWKDEEALLPDSCASPGPYRLLREWVHWPQRFAFAELKGMPASLRGYEGERVELWWFLNKDSLPSQPDEDSLRFFCTPAVNVERMSCAPIALNPNISEYSVSLPVQACTKYRVIGIEKVKSRTNESQWRELPPVHQIYNEKNTDYYIARHLPRWPLSLGANLPIAELEWRIAPSVQATPQSDCSEFLAVTVWVSRGSVGDILADDPKRWRLDYAAPVLAAKGVGFAVAGQQVPMPSLALLRAALVRFERFAFSHPESAALSLRQWFTGIESHFTLPGVLGLHVELTSRCVPWSVHPVHASGLLLTFEIDPALADIDRISGWLHIVAATLSRQLDAQAFVIARCRSNDMLYAECVVWR